MNALKTPTRLTSITQFLSDWNRRRFDPALPGSDDWQSTLEGERQAATREIEWVEQWRARVRERAATAPREAQTFLRWFEALREEGPGQGDPLFAWLEHAADREGLRWFLKQEVAGEAGFDDLVALTQVKMPTRPKLEMARNYWDEMGRGNENGMHGPMLTQAARELKVEELECPLLEPAVALGNLMAALAHHRRYAYHSAGALGAIELTAPTRADRVYRGLKRVGASPAATRYYLLHSTLDVKHSQAWNAEVLGPLVAERPECAPALAEGALLRLEAGLACFEAYRAHYEREGVRFDGELTEPRRTERETDSAPAVA